MDTAIVKNESTPVREFAELTAQARAAYQEKRTKECIDITQRVLLADPGNAEANALYEAVQADIQRDLNDARALLEDSRSMEHRSSEFQEDCNQLRERLEELTDVAAQRELERLHLKEEYERTTQILEEATSPTSIRGISTETVIAEEVRVEELIRELSLLIDDPGTELSAVIRKTVERAQLDYYLKGLRFSSTGESPSTH